MEARERSALSYLRKGLERRSSTSEGPRREREKTSEGAAGSAEVEGRGASCVRASTWVERREGGRTYGIAEDFEAERSDFGAPAHGHRLALPFASFDPVLALATLDRSHILPRLSLLLLHRAVAVLEHCEPLGGVLVHRGFGGDCEAA